MKKNGQDKFDPYEIEQREDIYIDRDMLQDQDSE
jgi:hypothetical protein